jgi:hypothetical protein
MYLDSPKGFILIGCIGGLYCIISGLVISLVGVSFRGSILLFIGVSSLFPVLVGEIFAYLSTVFPFISLIVVGSLGDYLMGTIIWDINIFGIIVSVDGFVIFLSAIGAWTGNRWYAAIVVLFGVIGLFAFINLGGLLGLVSGVVLWYDLK